MICYFFDQIKVFIIKSHHAESPIGMQLDISFAGMCFYREIMQITYLS